MPRIDRLITPPGWIASAKMYSMIISGGALYLVNTGKAANPTNLYNPMEKYRRLAEIMQQKYDEEIAKAEARIDAGELESLIDGKNSRRFSLGEVEELSVEDSVFKGNYILLKASGKKYVLIFAKERKKEMEDFIKSVGK